MTTTAVILTTYNDDHRLALVLSGFFNQDTGDPFELIVVNDGGRYITRAILDYVWRSDGPVTKFHYYYLQPPSSDFRLAKARNLGLKHVSAQQTIICDCDTVPHPSMVRVHQESFRQDTVLVGLRKRIAIADVDSCIESCVDPQWLEERSYTIDERLISKDLRRKYEGLETCEDPWRVTWGCNFSFATLPAHNLGGFDEEFVGWGGEDEDFARRLYRHGLKFKPLPNALVYHLDHPVRTQQNASKVFQDKFHADLVRNGGPLQYDMFHHLVGQQ